MSINLSNASDVGLALILLRVPVKDLIGKCTQVSPQWERILLENDFWRKKMDYDGYHLDWPKLVGISTKSLKWMAMKHCFNRNFINDCWNLELQNQNCLKLDPRWNADDVVWQGEEDIEHFTWPFAVIEVPPRFYADQPIIPPGLDTPIPACLATYGFDKKIVIKLADEGLTNEIMDKFRPTIVISEMVGNRFDSRLIYEIHCSLHANSEPIDFIFDGDDDVRESKDEFRDPNGLSVGVQIFLQFKQWQAGMRYLTLYCGGFGGGDRIGEDHFGLKFTNCSVKALFEKNAE